MSNSRSSKFPHLTLEINASQERSLTYHPTWLREHSIQNDKDNHFYIAASKGPLPTSAKIAKTDYLPKSIMNLTVPGYLANLKHNPNLILGNHPWAHNELHANTYSIVTTEHSLPFKNETLSRIVLNNTLTPIVTHSSAINLRSNARTLNSQITNKMLPEFDRALRSGGTIEFYEPSATALDARSAHMHFLETAKAKLENYDVRILSKKLILTKK